MNKQVARKLRAAAEKTAKIFSNHERAENHNKETFMVESIHPRSDTIAVAIFKKSSGKRAVYLMYYLPKVQGGSWWGFFPNDSHFIGLRDIDQFRQAIESKNYKLNFEEDGS